VAVWRVDGGADFFDRDAGVVADLAALAGELVEERGFPDVGVTDEGDLGNRVFVPGAHHVGRRNLNCGYEHLFGELTAEGEAGAAHGADEVAAVADFADAHFFAEPDFAELFAAGAVELFDLKFATHRRLTQVQGAVAFKFGGESHGGSRGH